MKVAIIGSNSFLAKKLIAKLGVLPIKVVLWNRSPEKDEHLFDFPNHLPDTKTLVGFDYIFYLAGSGVQSGEKPSHHLLYGVNVIVPVSIIAQLRDSNYQGRFITFGSYFELGQTNSEKLALEEDVLYSKANAFNEYSISKRLLSQFMAQQPAADSFYTMHFIVPNMFGVDENENRLVPYLVKSIKEERAVSLSSGNQVRQFLDVEEIVTLITSLIRDDNAKSGVFNLGSSNILSVRSLVDKIQLVAKRRGYKIPEIIYGEANRKDTIASYLALDDNKARELLGWNPSKSLEKSIEAYF